MHGTYVEERKLIPHTRERLISGDCLRFGAEVTRGPGTCWINDEPAPYCCAQPATRAAIRGRSPDACAVLLGEINAPLPSGLLVLPLKLLQLPQRVLPLPLERPSDDTVFRVDGVVAALRELRLTARPLLAKLPLLRERLRLRRRLLLDGEGQVDLGGSIIDRKIFSTAASTVLPAIDQHLGPAWRRSPPQW